MSFLARNLKVFSQFSPPEQVRLFFGLCASRFHTPINGTRGLINTKGQFEILMRAGIRLNRASDRLTLITDSSDSETGTYQVLVRRDSSDIDIFIQVILDKEYRPVFDLLNTGWPHEEASVIIDAGGYIGITGLYFHALFPNATIIVLEPNAENFSLLKRNVELNKRTNFSLLPAGLWGRDESLAAVEKFRDGQPWSFSLERSTGAEVNSIRGITLETLLGQFSLDHIDVLKMDIEGAERFVFEDEGRISAILSRVKVIAIEIHDEFNCREKIVDILKRNSFVLFQHGELTIGHNSSLADANKRTGKLTAHPEITNNE